MAGAPGQSPDDFPNELDDDLRARVKAELYPGERLLWTSRANRSHGGRTTPPPTSGIVAAASWLIAIGAIVVSSRDAQPLAAWFGITGIVAGFIAFVTTLVTIGIWYEWMERSRKRAETFYALTDRRAITWSPKRVKGGTVVLTIPRGKVSNVHRIEYGDGSGDVVFTLNDLHFHLEYPEGFQGVADVRRVEEQVRRTLIDDSGKSE